MRRLFAFGVVLGLGFVLRGILEERPAKVEAADGQGGGKVASANGDVNADQQVDITDAVYLLEFLFLGGPGPIPLAPCPPVVKGLPDTGQTSCFFFDQNQGWVPVSCAQKGCKGQDGTFATGCPIAGRFLDNGDGTVTDHCTGLMWQKDTGGGDLAWCPALDFCLGLTFAGHDDWRLPNVRELQSIVDYGRIDPAIDTVFGMPSKKAVCLSSTVLVGSSGSVWAVDFGDGALITGGVDSKGFVRAVRDTQ